MWHLTLPGMVEGAGGEILSGLMHRETNPSVM